MQVSDSAISAISTPMYHNLHLCCSEFRDQGLTRPKVLIVVPFREAARRIVEIMIQLLNPSDQVTYRSSLSLLAANFVIYF